jgi:hypothetical protein
MRTLHVNISEENFTKYNLQSGEIQFEDLVEIIKTRLARQALLECNAIADQAGVSDMALEDINAEIQAVRDAKNNYRH